MTINRVLIDAVINLKNAGVETAKLDAMILLEETLAKDRAYILAHGNDELTENETARFKNLLKRRISREPVAHITGKKEFYGRKFHVSEDVLTPRPETEFVISAAIKYAGNNPLILDLGTGSGCILLTTLLELSNASGVGVDASRNALAIAEQNAYDLGVKTARFIHSNWCEKLSPGQKFNIIVSNPPYIPASDKDTLEKELKFEPEMALFGGDDGLKCYREIAENIELIEFDYVILEIGINQKDQIEKIFGERNLKLVEVIADYAGIKRVLVFGK